ncbi:MAG: PilT-like protein [Candidatus Woesebacteria bacterium GW2011_GWB1_41_10]|uniref:Ribonuclease VapC n=1 Tax=Candidatus Woesebacteria bacterium GW2011_GWB1_41_10 TaxID=1618577 RepID=A0A0G0XER3_9BACT|nr:MAG: PilT-like protein [Candidatus Woesebacteria bacterium GW2011_GWB1_41_10]
MGKKDKKRMVDKYFLPDTNILIYALSDRQPYSSWFAKVIKEKKLVLSSLVVAEFLSGATKEEEISFRLLLENFDVLPVDSVVAQVAAQYRKKFLQKKKKVWMFDCLIAATCKVFGATLATFDKKDYPMGDIKVISEFSPLKNRQGFTTI